MTHQQRSTERMALAALGDMLDAGWAPYQVVATLAEVLLAHATGEYEGRGYSRGELRRLQDAATGVDDLAQRLEEDAVR